jgi:D-alanyl-D-alanine carboxypeptidase
MDLWGDAMPMTPMPGTVRANANLNVRMGAPSTQAPIFSKVVAGTELAVSGLTDGEAVSGNAHWYAGDNSTYFWSGACGSFRPQGAGGAPGGGIGNAPIGSLPVHRRPNGTIEPLSETEIRRIFGDVKTTEGAKGRVTLEAGWESANIVAETIPALIGIGIGKLKLHAKAVQSFKDAFSAIQAAGLEDRLITCAGTFVPRHKGWNPKRGLSPHTWAIAIDLNAEWNGYGKVPAQLGQYGTLRELVQIFEQYGFAWGGYFSSPYEDGMHFELARLDL